MSPARKKSAPLTYDLSQVKQYAAGQWPRILADIGGIDPDFLDGQHHPCPKCGGTDRFRLLTGDDKGAAICNQCFNTGNGDGFAVLQWITGQKFFEVLTRVAEYLGVQPTATTSSSKHSPKESSNPAEHLEFHDWNELSAAYWCLTKQPITPAAIQSIGGRLATYRKQYQVIALPVWRVVQNASGPQQETCGWIIYNATGGTLPKFSKHLTTGEITTEWLKIKLTAGSQPGLVGDLASIRSVSTTTIWKVEGPSDLLALLSLELPADQAAFTNANGAGEKPAPWMLELLAGRTVHTIHDADKPGQDGAMFKTDHQGNQRPGWVPCLAERSTAKNILLPYEIAETHGKDLRDWIREGGTVEQLQAMAEATPIHTTTGTLTPIESEDDPNRLARVNIQQYEQQTRGKIRFWRQEWFTWKPSRGCYRALDDDEFRSKLHVSIKQEFDRLNLAKQQEADDDKEPEVRRVTNSLVANVVSATKSISYVSASTELNTWIGSSPSMTAQQNKREFLAVQNGLIDMQKLIDSRGDCDVSEILLPHSPDWFSTVRLPCDFDLEAKCPAWEAFLEKNLELDPERIKLLQEWAGYLLLPDTGHQKFLVLEGEGANGKSVYCAGLSAMLGRDNCSHVPIEMFGDRFSKTQTVGKLVNICADVGEIEKASEGNIKSFVSGDVMYFDRKGIKGISCEPTARLMIACNNRPRFSDKSSGIWRRMLIVPWRVQIQPNERIPNMDKMWWWEQRGELSGIFMWALRGLIRLRVQGRFTESQICREALEDYQEEMNPARTFFLEHLEKNNNARVRSSLLYALYVKWTEQNGYRPLSDRQFGKELKRIFPNSNRKKNGNREDRFWFYEGISFVTEKIAGESTSDSTLF